MTVCFDLPVYGAAVCIYCDQVDIEHVGAKLYAKEYGECPECGALLYGLVGTEIADE